MKEVDDHIARESKGIVLQLESDYREAKQREGLIRQALELRKPKPTTWPKKWSSTTSEERVGADKSLYDGLLTKLRKRAFEGLNLQPSCC